VSARDEFREAVTARDCGRCVACGEVGVDAHHIIDRSLWPDGGYLLNNGVLLCPRCHMKAELTSLSCYDLRQMAGITSRVLPPAFSEDNEYDHWGNIVVTGDVRHPGPLFDQPNVQKILRETGYIDRFSWDAKYPRTYHFSYSPGVQNDDRMHMNDDLFDGLEVVGTVKMDGEGTTMMNDRVHARSLNSGPHRSRDWMAALHGRVGRDIPFHWRICGENLYAEHSIRYEHLQDYFTVFSIWDETNRCLPWDITIEYANLMDLATVPVFYRGTWNKEIIDSAFEEYCSHSDDPVEGYVIRLARAFRYESFAGSTAKWVRKNHVQTDQFWMHKPVTPNKLETV